MLAAEQLGDLDGVQRGTLAEIVAHDPQRQAILDRRILAHAADEGGVMPGASRRIRCASAALISSSNSMFTASEWPTNTGTRTQVAVTLILGSRIFLVSTTIFHSSLVEPSSRKLSMCGMTLNAICLVNFTGSLESPTKMLRDCSNSSSIPAFPAPET